MRYFRLPEPAGFRREYRDATEQQTDGTHQAAGIPSRGTQAVPFRASLGDKSNATASSRFGLLIWAVTILAAAITLGYATLRNPAKTAAAAREAQWEARELLKPTPPIEESLAKIETGRQGYFQPTLCYPPEFISAVKRAQRDGLDILADFLTLEKAWKAEAGAKPLTLTFIHDPVTDTYTNQRFHSALRSSEPVNEANFRDAVVWLRDIRSLILDGDGTGAGILPRIGCPAVTGGISAPVN